MFAVINHTNYVIKTELKRCYFFQPLLDQYSQHKHHTHVSLICLICFKLLPGCKSQGCKIIIFPLLILLENPSSFLRMSRHNSFVLLSTSSCFENTFNTNFTFNMHIYKFMMIDDVLILRSGYLADLFSKYVPLENSQYRTTRVVESEILITQ